VYDYILNPSLAATMKKVFPNKFGVINGGQPLEGFYYDDVQHDTRRLRVVRWGEGYTTDCPFCTDTRGRFTINHRWGVYDSETGFNGYELWRCYNEECQADPSHRRELRDKLTAHWLTAPVVKVPKVKKVEKPKLEPVEFPGILVPLTELPKTHHAITYLQDRGFDPNELSRLWRISYAEHVPARTRGAMSSNRIIIPVYDGGVMVGWQARFVGEVDWKATGVQKYLTYYPKSLCFYGMDEAENEDTLVIVEGATSVWRYGFGALPLLGKTMSAVQTEIMIERGRGRPVVLIPDNKQDSDESIAAFQKVASQLEDAAYPGCIGYAPLPPGTDPANLTTAQLRNLTKAVVNACR
jgi:hypothetical protein